MHRALAEAIELFERGLAESERSEDRRHVEQYLAELAPMLAAAVLGNDILGRLRQAERLFGRTGLIDQTPFEPAFTKWREFKTEYEKFAVRGMTVNERLNAFSLTDVYDQAVSSRDLDGVQRILQAIHVDETSIVRIIETVSRDNERRS